MDVRRIIREEIEKVNSPSEEESSKKSTSTTNDSNYEFPPLEAWDKLEQLKNTGKSLDSNVSENLSELQVLSTGERSGRMLAEVGYPDGTVVLFYKSMKGTSNKTQGDWYPIAGFLSENHYTYKKGWFIKDSDIKKVYGSKTFEGTSNYLSANESTLEEIDLSVGGHGLKPGQPRKFPQDNEGGYSLNLSVSDGPHQFPKGEDL